MNLLGLLVDKGLLSATDRGAVEAELAQKHSLREALSAHNISLDDALAAAGKGLVSG
jgi:gamma-glutamylcysteine synthetase